MRFHSQNLNEKPFNRKGTWLKHSRFWWHIGKLTLNVEWLFKVENSAALEMELGTGEDTAVGFYIGMFLFKLFVNFNHFAVHNRIERAIKRPDEKYGSGREIGIKWHDNTLWFSLWYDPMEHRSKDPKWWSFTFNFADFFFGRTKYESKTLLTERVLVPMPEASYPATVKINEDTWKRVGWPWAWHRAIRAEITPDKPIPFPGKGENSWDCGEDASHSMYCSASTPLEAVTKFQESVMRDRIRHGSGWNWRPEAQAKA